MRVSAIQMSPGADKAANLAQAEQLIRACAAADRPDLMILPEIWSCLGGNAAAKREAAEILPDPPGTGGPAYELLRSLATSLHIHIHGGSIGERIADDPHGHLYNITLVFGPDGAELARYRKLHLFDIVAPDGAGYRESALYRAGDRVVTCTIAGVPTGLAICYDLRFAELFLALRDAGAELITLPAAFTLQTGRDHWEPLIRARAIETQCWIAAAATCGRHYDITADGPAERHTYGHSMICDPWGHIVARASDGPGWATARLDAALTARVRANMPVRQHRRDAALLTPRP